MGDYLGTDGTGGSSGVPTTRTITAGTGLTGGGDLSADRTVAIAAGGVGPTQLAATAVTPAAYSAADITVDQQGRLTAAATHQMAATKRVMGRNTAGAGAVEEVTASQLFDWVSNTNGVLLTRTAGTWAAVANVTTDNGDVVIADNATPVAPSAGSKIVSQIIAGRSMPGCLPAVGNVYKFQPSMARKAIGMWNPQGNATALALYGATAGGAPFINGTATARNPVSTSMFTSARRLGYVSAGGAGSVAGIDYHGFQSVWRGNASGLGGFFYSCRFGVADAVLVATANMFVGLRGTAAPTDVGPQTLVNLLGVGCTNGDTQLQLYSAGSGAQARVALGASFPVNTISTDIYELAMFCPPNAATVQYQVTRINTGDIATGTVSVSANLPSTTTFLAPECWRSNGGTATAVAIDLMSMYLETDI